MGKYRKQLGTFFKFLISALLIYFIFTKLNIAEVWSLVQETNVFYLIAALSFFILSKVLASVRLNLYFHQLRVYLTQQSNGKLYLLGMFYNLFLPGGIGGDAYKGYVIKNSFNVKTKKVVSILVLDRLSGLLLLFIYACILAIILNQGVLQNLRLPFSLAVVLSIMFFWGLNKKFFPTVLPVFWKSLAVSTLVQLAQLISVFFILKGLQIESNTLAYLFVFLISSIVAVLPLTIGGIGSREITFFYGATWLSLEQDASVGISMVFFLITAAVSLLGIVYHFKKPELITEEAG